MTLRVLMVAIAAVTGWHGQAQADDQERLASAAQRQRYLEERLQAQVEQRPAADVRADDHWTSRVRLGGLVELEGAYSKAEAEQASSELSVATVELALTAQVNDWIGAQTALLYEGEDVEVDMVQVTLARPSGGWSLTAGRLYVPFGRFDTQMVSDPLTLELGETSETALSASVDSNGVSAAAYVFSGTNRRGDDVRLDKFGLNLGYGLEGAGCALEASVGYINDISDANNLQHALVRNDGVDYVGGWTAGFTVHRGLVTVIGEYVAALDGIAGLAGAQPKAWSIEAGFGFTLDGHEATLAASYQGSSQAEGLELPERRSLAAVSGTLVEHTTLTLELARERGYGGSHTRSATVQLLVAF